MGSRFPTSVDGVITNEVNSLIFELNSILLLSNAQISIFLAIFMLTNDKIYSSKFKSLS